MYLRRGCGFSVQYGGFFYVWVFFRWQERRRAKPSSGERERERERPTGVEANIQSEIKKCILTVKMNQAGPGDTWCYLDPAGARANYDNFVKIFVLFLLTDLSNESFL